MSAVIARPASLRGNGVRFMVRMIYVGIAIGITTGVTGYQLYFKPRQKRLHEYLNNTDSYKLLKDMCAKNLLQSCPENLKKREAEARK